ncbi:MAG TPA: VIT domain-containing protein, partial [Phycisphaerales bacterium]|nr:VIT domain-containing protein [Phycisphaerales bacterium]
MSNEHEHDLERLPHDELDALLRAWHEENAERAAAGKAQMIARLHTDTSHSLSITGDELNPLHRSVRARLAAASRSASLRAAASLGLLITAIALLIPLNSRPALARQEVIMLPEGGKLEAHDARGQVIGPCALKHTDVHADIAGPFSRVTVKQQYHNPYAYKIEAVYTFPLSHRAAVDRMTMTVGDRIIEGEVHERQQARQMYESARQAGHVASLLEQERPNIFTQSVANIEPNADVLIEISYIEMLQQRDGEYTFDFPMVVAPRYIPGNSIGSLGNARQVGIVGALPNELERRDGVILLGPATFERQKLEILGAVEQGNLQFNKTPKGPAPFLQRIIDVAVPIMTPDGAYRAREDVQALYRANPNYDFDVLYADGTREFGQIAGDGLGHVAGRWFYFEPSILIAIQREDAGDAAAFAADTNQVPDASRITPMPVRPPTRAGHDISLSVHIDTGE